MPTVEREHEEVRQGTVPAVRGDRVRWGPVWAGLVIALGTYLLLQLALLATGITDLADPGTQGPLVVDDVDAHYRRAKAAGAEIMYEPRDTYYGSREYGARDFEGNAWSFGTYVPKP